MILQELKMCNTLSKQILSETIGLFKHFGIKRFYLMISKLYRTKGDKSLGIFFETENCSRGENVNKMCRRDL